MDDKLDLITRLSSYIARMAPHQKEREGGQLIIEAFRELRMLEQVHHSIIKRSKEYQSRGVSFCEVLDEDE